jgi:hypothetical protein
MNAAPSAISPRPSEAKCIACERCAAGPEDEIAEVFGPQGQSEIGSSGAMLAAGERPRCSACRLEHPIADFIGKRGRIIGRCVRCQRIYGGWSSKTLAEKIAARADRYATSPPKGRIRWVPAGHNRKLGGIPATYSERGTCPPSCGLYRAGCFAEYGWVGLHWRNTEAEGIPWAVFLERVRELPAGQLWRHNVAGDLPGEGEQLDEDLLAQLVEANRGRKGFTFSHKVGNLEALQWANLEGFTINLSADTLEDADALFQVGDGDDLTVAGPVVVLLPHDAPDAGVRTPGGRRVVVCPNETHGVTCDKCRLCADPYRTTIIGFRAHGKFKHHVPELVQLRRKGRAS